MEEYIINTTEDMLSFEFAEGISYQDCRPNCFPNCLPQDDCYPTLSD